MTQLSLKLKNVFSLIGFSFLFSNAYATINPIETADAIMQRLITNGDALTPDEIGKGIYKYRIENAQKEIKGTFAIWGLPRSYHSQYMTPYTMAVWNGMSHYYNQELIPAIFYITDAENTEASGGTNSVTAGSIVDANSLTHLAPLVTKNSLFDTN